MSLAKLPTQLQEMIFAHLFLGSLDSLIRVSREHQMFMEPFLYRNLVVYDNQKFHIARLLVELLARRYLIQHIQSFLLIKAPDDAPPFTSMGEQYLRRMLHTRSDDIREIIFERYHGRIKPVFAKLWFARISSMGKAFDAALAVLLCVASNLQEIVLTESRHTHLYCTHKIFYLRWHSSHERARPFSKLKRLAINDTSGRADLTAPVLPSLEHIILKHCGSSVCHSHLDFPYPANFPGSLRSLRIIKVKFHPELLEKYLARLEFRSLQYLQVIDQPPQEKRRYPYDYRRLTAALSEFAPALQGFEWSYQVYSHAGGIFGTFNPLSSLHRLVVDYSLLQDTGSVLGPYKQSPHLLQPTVCFPASLRTLHITNIKGGELSQLCKTFAKTPTQRMVTVKFILDRLQSLPLGELHLQVCMTTASPPRTLELRVPARKFLPRLVSELDRRGCVMRVWRQKSFTGHEVLLYEPGYAAAWPHWADTDRKRWSSYDRRWERAVKGELTGTETEQLSTDQYYEDSESEISGNGDDDARHMTCVKSHKRGNKRRSLRIVS